MVTSIRTRDLWELQCQGDLTVSQTFPPRQSSSFHDENLRKIPSCLWYGRESVAIMKYSWSFLHKNNLILENKVFNRALSIDSETLPTLALLSLSDLPKRKIKKQKHHHQGQSFKEICWKCCSQGREQEAGRKTGSLGQIFYFLSLEIFLFQSGFLFCELANSRPVLLKGQIFLTPLKDGWSEQSMASHCSPLSSIFDIACSDPQSKAGGLQFFGSNIKVPNIQLFGLNP